MKKPSVGMVSLGCPKNLVDSEVMLGLLASQKFTLAPSIDHCDVAVINTCSFIDASRKESLDNIQELAQMKRDGKIKGLIVAGCLGQLQSDTLRDQIPEIDAILGTGEYPRIPQVVDEVAGGGKPWFVDKPTYVYDEKTPRLLLTPRHSAYVKISEGCNHPCSFCIIPRLRGRHRSRTLGSIVEEVRSLSQQGIKEINLVAQDSSFYGFDLVKESLLPQLLNELNQIEGIRWIRVLYLYPKHTTDKILDAFVNNKKVVPYVDCPLQHINDRVLSHMKRRVTRKETENLIQRVRQRMPGGIFRTTFIVGYPTETDAEFNELKEFVRESRFERMGVFRYSYEPLTVSGKSEDQVPEDIKQKRRHELMILQQEISSQWLTSFRGKLVNVLVEGQDKNDSSIWVGRSALDAPEIDGQVLFQNAEGNIPAVGDIVRVQIQDSTEYDLIGVRTDESR